MTRVQVKRLAPLVVVFLALGLVLLARSDFGVGPTVPYVSAPILQATVDRGYGLRWRDSTRTKLMIRRIDPTEGKGQKDWSLGNSVGRVGLLSEYDLASRTVRPLEPDEWPRSSEPCNYDPAPRARKGLPPELHVDDRGDFLYDRRSVKGRMLTKADSMGVSGRVYLGDPTADPRKDRVAIPWCTRHVSKGGIVFGGENRWGGELNVEFRSLTRPEKRGPSVRLKSAASEFDPPTIVWTWDSSAIVVVDDRNMGFWYVPCPDLSELEK